MAKKIWYLHDFGSWVIPIEMAYGMVQWVFKPNFNTAVQYSPTSVANFSGLPSFKKNLTNEHLAPANKSRPWLRAFPPSRMFHCSTVFTTIWPVGILAAESQKFPHRYFRRLDENSIEVPTRKVEKIHQHSQTIIWRLPEMGVPPVIIYFSKVFPNKNHPFWGTPILGKPPYEICVKSQ